MRILNFGKYLVIWDKGELRMKMFGQRKYHFCWRIKTVRQRQEVIVFFEEEKKNGEGKGGKRLEKANIW